MRLQYDAIVIGAGPAGTASAILLARAGWSVALVEKQRFPRRKVCGECLAASNLPLLDALGAGDAFADQAGAPLRLVAWMGGHRSITAPLPPARHDRHAWGRALGRETLDTLLVDQARSAGATVLQPWSVQAVGGRRGAHSVSVRSLGDQRQEDLQAPVLIAAHGSWEALPAGRAVRRQRRRVSDLLAFKANFRNAALADGLLPVLSLPGGYGGMVRADHGITTLACCVRADRLDELRRASPGLRAGAVVEAWLKSSCDGVAQALEGAQRDGPWLATGPIDPGIRLQASDSHFRVGNAAGEAHPVIGEGMSMALQSAWLLCGRLTEHGATPASARRAGWQHDVQARYVDDWHRHFAGRLRLAAAVAHLTMRPGLSAPLWRLLQRWPGLMTTGARWGGKVRCAVNDETLRRFAPLMPLASAAPRPACSPVDRTGSTPTWHDAA